MAEHKNEREQSKTPDTAGKTKGRAESHWSPIGIGKKNINLTKAIHMRRQSMIHVTHKTNHVIPRPVARRGAPERREGS